MSPTSKILIGLAAVLLIGFVHHGPMGAGDAYVGAIETRARNLVAEVPGVEARLGHAPLSRRATLAGPADSFQRVGMGGFPGLTERVASIPGVSGVQWADEREPTPGVPLLLEKWALLILGFAVGLGLGWLLFGRPRRETYL